MSLVRLFLLVSLLITLQACRIIQKVPQGGTIVSNSGNYNCSVTEKCIIDIRSGEPFKETFTAVPQPGYIFKKWKRADSYLCGGKKTPCVLNLSGDHTAYDIDVFLKPIFVLGYDQYLVNALNGCETDKTESLEAFVDGRSVGWIHPGTRIKVPMSAKNHDVYFVYQDGTVGDTQSAIPSTDTGYFGWGCADSFSLSNYKLVDRDSDGDGYTDEDDAFPKDASKWWDIDGNGSGDNQKQLVAGWGDVALTGQTGFVYDAVGNLITVEVDEVVNTSALASGSLKVEMWAFGSDELVMSAGPWCYRTNIVCPGHLLSGFVLGNGQPLDTGRSYRNISVEKEIATLPDGTYDTVVLLLRRFSPAGYYTDDEMTFDTVLEVDQGKISFVDTGGPGGGGTGGGTNGGTGGGTNGGTGGGTNGGTNGGTGGGTNGGTGGTGSDCTTGSASFVINDGQDPTLRDSNPFWSDHLINQWESYAPQLYNGGTGRVISSWDEEANVTLWLKSYHGPDTYPLYGTRNPHAVSDGDNGVYSTDDVRWPFHVASSVPGVVIITSDANGKMSGSYRFTGYLDIDPSDLSINVFGTFECVPYRGPQ